MSAKRMKTTNKRRSAKRVRVPLTRSEIMARVKSRDTGPELAVRRALHGMGYRYRLRWRDLPCRPDVLFPGRRAAIFVHGCFWHAHDCEGGIRVPKANNDYWAKKLATNEARDLRQIESLANQDWRSLVIWECELRCHDWRDKLRRFLGPTNMSAA